MTPLALQPNTSAPRRREGQVRVRAAARGQRRRRCRVRRERVRLSTVLNSYMAHRRRTHVTAGQSKWAVESSCTRLSRKLDYRNKGTGTDNRNKRTRPLFRKTPRDFAGIEVRHFDSDENFTDALAAFDAALEVRRLSPIIRCQQ